jgi:hypothetical protein
LEEAVDQKKQYVLKHPFKSLVSKEMVESVQMRVVCKVGDFRAARKFSKESEDQTFLMIVRLSGLDEAEVDQLAMEDFNALAGMISWGGEDAEGKA